MLELVRAGRETGLSDAHRTIGLEVLCMVVRASSESQWNIYFCHLPPARDHQEHTCRSVSWVMTRVAKEDAPVGAGVSQ